MSNRTGVLAAAVVLGVASFVFAQPVVNAPVVDKWVTVQGEAAGTDLKAQDEAVKAALRKAVEQACGTFLSSETKAQDYKAVYDKIFADTVGYVIEHKVGKVVVDGNVTKVTVTARVSTQKFEKDWAVIRHTVTQENNPRVIIAISEKVRWATTADANIKVEEAGNVQSKIEDFFLSKGIVLVDRGTTEKVSKRDIVLASMRDDAAEIAALGARFHADVVITGQGETVYSGQIAVSGVTMHKYTASLRVRAIRTDTGQVLVADTFGPIIATTLQAAGGEAQAQDKLATECAPKLLAKVVEAWRKQTNVARDIELNILGMDYKGWQAFNKEVSAMRGVQGVHRREITESVANISVEYEYDLDQLADKLTNLESIKLEVVEITANRIKMKVVK